MGRASRGLRLAVRAAPAEQRRGNVEARPDVGRAQLCGRQPLTQHHNKEIHKHEPA